MAKRIIPAVLSLFIFILPLTESGFNAGKTRMDSPNRIMVEALADTEVPEPEPAQALTEEPPAEPVVPQTGAVSYPQASQNDNPNESHEYSPSDAVIEQYKKAAEILRVITTNSFPKVCMSDDYIVFRRDMKSFVENAEKASGIRSAYGVLIMDLSSGYLYGVNENLTRTDPADNSVEGYFNSASVIKLFQGYILCDMMRRGELDMDKTYYDAVTGRRFKLLNMIKTMISRSDNNYSNATLRLVGNGKSNEVLKRLGIYYSKIYGEMSEAIGYSTENNINKYGTDKRCARLTPRDAGLILYNVYINRENDIYMKTMNEALLGNIYNTRIPVGVSRVGKGIPVAHKTGTNSELGVYNDAGIIYCSHPFILVAFTQSTTITAGQGFIRNLAENLTLYFKMR